MNGVRHKEGHDASEDGYHGHGGHALDDEKIQSHGGGDQPDFRHAHHQDAEPYRVDAVCLDERIENRHGEQNNSHGIHEAAQNDHDQQHAEHD